MYYLEKEAIDFLNKKLKLPVLGNEQDWDIELADNLRLEEFIELLKHDNLSKVNRLALMALILASYDDLLNKGRDKNDFYWKQINDLLINDAQTYRCLLEYWAFMNEDAKNAFKITLLIRNVLAQSD